MSGAPLSHFDVSRLLDLPGSRREISGDYDFEQLRTSSATTTAVRYDLVMESAGSQIVAEGLVVAGWSSECRRCLEPVVGESEIAVREIFEISPTEGETYPIDGTQVDLALMLDEAVLLGLPLVPLCGASCAGPEPGRFPTGPEPEENSSATPDPRWAALDDLSFE